MLNLPVVLMGLGLAAGMARGGSLRRFFTTKFQGFWLIPAGLGMQGALEVLAAFDLGTARSVATVAMVLSYLALIAFAWLNRDLPGMWWVAGGLALNLIVIAANGAMPVSRPAAEVAGVRLDEILRGAVRHEVATPGSRFVFLADTIGLPGLRTVISAGDCLVGGGLFRLMDKLVRYEPKRLA